MRISSFRVENFRNIRLAECANPPDFIVICGGNGCGKSALLQALVTAKENAAPYGRFRADPRAVSADAEFARIEMMLAFSAREREWYQAKHRADCPATDSIVIEIAKGGSARTCKRSKYTQQILSFFSREFEQSPGFFDYIEAYRMPQKKDLSTWNAASLSDDQIKTTLTAPGQEKFQFTKEYLASLKLADAQQMLASHRRGKPEFPDSLEPIRDFFNRFFSPMAFVDVEIDASPFKYIVRTPRGDIDIDDLSAGEKEVLNTYVRFHQLRPHDAVILFDEADAHLHPDLERRYLEVLRELGRGNQVWLTTHSPEMMIQAGSDALFTVLKEPQTDDGNQFVQVTTDERLHDSLSELMGSRGLVSFNQRIVFIEGSEASTDRLVYERFYPASRFNISFVPAGDSGSVRRVAERVNDLLTSGVGFQQFYSLVDGDLERIVAEPANGRLHKLPVYHVENFLLNEDAIFQVASEVLGEKCPYANAEDVTADLKTMLFEDQHLNPFAKAVYDSRLARMAREAYNAVFSSGNRQPSNEARPEFGAARRDAEQVLRQAVQDGNWKAKCKGRDLLKVFCRKHGIRYEHFRNLVINKLAGPPAQLQAIIDQILSG